MTAPNMYPAPHFDEREWQDLRRQIESGGFTPDPFLGVDPDQPVYGLNIAFGWPLPASLKEPYERLACALSSLAPGLYVYPYEETHVTVMTLISFKNHKSPDPLEVETLQELIPSAISLISDALSADRNPWVRSFVIDVGAPVLSRNAAFLPILNPTREILHLRADLASVLSPSIFPRVEIPMGLHSTILRFVKAPVDARSFTEAFESLAADLQLGGAIIHELLLTSETRPYMRGGEILHRFPLGVREPSRPWRE